MTFDRLKSDGTATGTTLSPSEEERAIPGEELWWPPGTGSAAGVIVTERTALQLSAVLATVNVVATDVAVLPLCVHQKQKNGNRREATEHPAYELVTRSPDGETTPIKWKQTLMGHALDHGNGYAEIQRRGRGTPYALHLLDPDTTRAVRKEGRLGYQISNGKWVEAANVLHVAGLGYDGVSGYNFVRLIRQCIGLGMAAETYGADYFSNGSEPNGVIETPERLKPEAIKALREGWEDVHGGAGKRHRTAVLSGGAKFNATSADPESSQLLETRKFQVTDAVRPWRVPPHKVGDFSQAHLSNIEASNLDYLMTALMGWLVGIEQECDLKLLSRAEWQQGYYFEHNVNALLRGDIASRFGAYEIATRNGWMSRDEVRQRENQNPIGKKRGGQIYTVQSQNIPLEDVGKAPAAPPVPPPTPTDPQQDPAADPKAPPAAKREARFNPNHGKDGKFAGGHGGGGGGGHGAMSDTDKISRANELGEALADHDNPVNELSKEVPEGTADEEWYDDAIDQHNTLLTDQEDARDEQVKDQKSDLKDFQRDQKDEAKEFDREQKSDLKEFDRDQKDELKQFDKDGKEAAKDFKKDEDDPEELANFDSIQAQEHVDFLDGQQSERVTFVEGQAEAKATFHQEQKDAHKSFLEDQATDRESLLDTQRDERASLISDLAIELFDMAAEHEPADAEGNN